MRYLKSSKGKELSVPCKVFCYHSVLEILKGRMQSEEFRKNCVKWQTERPTDGMMHDVYDGAVWRNFVNSDGQLFFTDAYNFGLLLNIDWYQPFKHTIYSVGVMFITIFNLPRHLRYRPENVILCGIIPGPSEPRLTVNQHLEPLIDDLQSLWKGVTVTVSDQEHIIKAALICVSCDTPATRKTCGFLAHSALRGCFKCLKAFPTSTFGSKPQYGGFNRDQWKPRTNAQHRAAALRHKFAKTLSEQSAIEQAEGVRYSELLRLPYFDAISFVMIDPMHNLLLGTAKRLMKVWKQNEVLNEEAFCTIQSWVDKFVIPSDIGRIPSKIQSEFNGFTADQWKHWILLYSLVCMKNYLGDAEYDCWQKFVAAVSIFCHRIISMNDIVIADKLMLEFCQKFEELYGEEECTPNLHLHCHLSTCVINYGPTPTFWLFGFERINGILGKFQTNHHLIEPQLMRKFTTAQQVKNLSYTGLSEEYTALLSNVDKSTGSVTVQNESVSLKDHEYRLLPPIKEASFNSSEKDLLDQVICHHHGNFQILMLHKYSSAAIINGEIYGTLTSRQKSSSLIIAIVEKQMVPCFVKKIVKASAVDLAIANCEIVRSFIFLYVSKLVEHSQKNHFGHPVEIWQYDCDFNDNDPSHHLFIPLSSVMCRCAYSTLPNSFGITSTDVDLQVLTVSPINMSSFKF